MTHGRRGWPTLRRVELHPQTSRRSRSAHKENKHETGRTKKLPEVQETKDTPGYEEVPGGKEIDSPGKVGNGKPAEALTIVLARTRCAGAAPAVPTGIDL